MGATNGIFSDDSMGNGPLYIFDVNNERDIVAVYQGGADTEVYALMSDGFQRTTSGWKYRELGVGFGDVAADNDAFTYPLFRAKNNITIQDAWIGFDATVTSNATNYQTLYLEQSGSSTDLSTLTTASSGFTAEVPRQFASIDSTAGQLSAGDTLQLRIIQNGSGVTMTGGVISIGYTIDQPKSTVAGTDYLFRFCHDVGTAAVWGGDTAGRPLLSVRELGAERYHIDVNGVEKGSAALSETDYTPVDQYYYAHATLASVATADSGATKTPIFSPHATIEVVGAYWGTSTTYAANSDTNYWQIKLTDGTNILADAYLKGPYQMATSTTKGLLYDMGDINREYSQITSSENLMVEYVEGGTGPTVTGVTVVVVYKKIA